MGSTQWKCANYLTGFSINARISATACANVIMGFLAGLGGRWVSVYASAMPDIQYSGEMDVIAACVISERKHERWTWNHVGAFLGSIILYATIAKLFRL